MLRGIRRPAPMKQYHYGKQQRSVCQHAVDTGVLTISKTVEGQKNPTEKLTTVKPP